MKMKNLLQKSILIVILAFSGLSINLNAQTLFKDLNPGNTSSSIQNYTNVNGTLYFNTIVNYTYQIWKSDGTAANTIMVKDKVITTNTGSGITFEAHRGDTLYYTIKRNPSGLYLWKTNGNTPTLVDSIYGGNFKVLGDKMFFVGSKNGSTNSLCESNGTGAGTKPVAGIALVLKSVTSLYNGKLYFAATRTDDMTGDVELYSSDGTAAGTMLVKEINSTVNTQFHSGRSTPGNFIVCNNELYFTAYDGTSDGIWKTDGSEAGTVKIATPVGFELAHFVDAKVFKNQVYYSVSNILRKIDGNTVVTVKELVGSICGANNDNIFTAIMIYIATPPYYGFQYWKSDGTTAGTVQVSDSLGGSASFVVLNNKMYNPIAFVGYTNAMWETDGTDAGTKKLIVGYLGTPFIFNNTVFFANNANGLGCELWSYSPVLVSGINDNFYSTNTISIYPNPSSGKAKIEWNGSKNASIKVFNLMGKEVLQQVISNEIDLSNYPKGIYIVKVSDGQKIYSNKIVIQ